MSIVTVIVVLLAVVALFLRKRIFIKTEKRTVPSMTENIANNDDRTAGSSKLSFFNKMVPQPPPQMPSQQQKKKVTFAVGSTKQAPPMPPMPLVGKVPTVQGQAQGGAVQMAKKSAEVPPSGSMARGGSASNFPPNPSVLEDKVEEAPTVVEDEPPVAEETSSVPHAPSVPMDSAEDGSHMKLQMDPDTNPLLVAKRASNQDPNFTPVNLNSV